MKNDYAWEDFNSCQVRFTDILSMQENQWYLCTDIRNIYDDIILKIKEIRLKEIDLIEGTFYFARTKKIICNPNQSFSWSSDTNRFCYFHLDFNDEDEPRDTKEICPQCHSTNLSWCQMAFKCMDCNHIIYG